VVADVAEEGAVERIAEKAVAAFGGIDTWVNDAGVAIYGRLEEVSEADSRRLFDVNFWGLVRGSLVALRHMKEEGGAIINLGSEVSDAVVPFQGMYSASKHAVKGFTDALRVEVQELDKAPVAITLIQPTAVDTPYPQHAKNYMDKEPKLPTPQIQPEKVAAAILEAATSETREMKVGAMSTINSAIAKMSPGLAKKLQANRPAVSNTTSRRAIPTGRCTSRARAVTRVEVGRPARARHPAATAVKRPQRPHAISRARHRLRRNGRDPRGAG